MTAHKARSIRVSASQLHRVIQCPASAVLPKARNESVAATKGIAVHQYLELVATIGRTRALEKIAKSYPEQLSLCKIIDTDSLPVELAHEVAYALDVESGEVREIGRGGGVDYRKADLASYEIPGRADVVGVSGDSVYVGDYKTGWGELPPVAENPQLLFLALCAARVYSKDSATVEIIRVRDDGSAWRDRAELDAIDLDAFREQLARLPGQVEQRRSVMLAGAAPNVSAGSWCKYCPSFHVCPAKVNLAISLGNGEAIADGYMTPELAARTWGKLKAAKELLGKIESSIYALASEQPIPLGDGKVLGKVHKKGVERINGDIAYEVMFQFHGAALANEATKRTVTKSSIKAALSGHVPKLAPEMRKLLTAIGERGGSERKPTTRIEEYKPKTE